MKQVQTVGLVADLLFSLTASAENKKSREIKTVKAYASVDSLKMYYEIHGVGKPLILLHGGVGGIEMFGPNLSALSKTHQVIAVDLQAHGRTADIDRPLLSS